MTFYQELQVNQAGSKKIIRESASQREKLYHIAVYLTKIAITVAFCFIFVSLYSLGFGADNSIVGVVVLLYLLVFLSLIHICGEVRRTRGGGQEGRHLRFLPS